MKTLRLSTIAVAILGLASCSDGDNGIDGVNGNSGTDGTNGLNSLVVQTALAMGDTQCPNSGVKIDSGLDNDANGSLETTEVTATEYVCRAGVTSVRSSEMLTSLNNNWFTEGAQQVEEAKQVWLTNKIVELEQ